MQGARGLGMRAAAVCACALIAALGRLAAQPEVIPKFDAAAVERGKTAFVGSCGFCHGSNARGGENGPDLVRSVIVLDDEGGRGLGKFLRQGRPDKGMPSFALPGARLSDIATFLHSQVAAAAFRNTYTILDILVGDPKAGAAYFNGAGKCNTCHSPSGDLKGIGAKYDPVKLQGKIVMPRQGATDGPPVHVTVTLASGETVSGELLRLTDFDVTLRDSNGARRTYARNGDSPKVETKDPMQAHIDLLPVYKDKDIHDLTAYLATLK
jgi:cytochrome c oxidase cbb3-type subunit 3